MKRTRLTILTLAIASISSPAVFADGGKLAQEKGCLSCHDITAKKIGPAFQEVSKKYKGDANAEKALAGKIKAGGSGVWGAIPMPPQSTLSDEDAQALVKWVMSQ